MSIDSTPTDNAIPEGVRIRDTLGGKLIVLPRRNLLRQAPWLVLSALGLPALLVLMVYLVGGFLAHEWEIVAFLGLVAVRALVAILPTHSAVRLAADGVTFRNGFGPLMAERKLKWEQVTRLEVDAPAFRRRFHALLSMETLGEACLQAPDKKGHSKVLVPAYPRELLMWLAYAIAAYAPEGAAEAAAPAVADLTNTPPHLRDVFEKPAGCKLEMVETDEMVTVVQRTNMVPTVGSWCAVLAIALGSCLMISFAAAQVWGPMELTGRALLVLLAAAPLALIPWLISQRKSTVIIASEEHLDVIRHNWLKDREQHWRRRAVQAVQASAGSPRGSRHTEYTSLIVRVEDYDHSVLSGTRPEILWVATHLRRVVFAGRPAAAEQALPQAAADAV